MSSDNLQLSSLAWMKAVCIRRCKKLEPFSIAKKKSLEKCEAINPVKHQYFTLEQLAQQ
uniref:Uncharacterized protein n=1 Tax=Arundo donax TaxID=35708 RepID=A0A0A8YS27_ARUDO